MKYLKAFLLIVFFFVSMLFFVQNTGDLSRSVVIKLSVLSFSYSSPELPIYLMILASFAIGALVACLYFMADKLRGAAAVREEKARVASLQAELSKLTTPSVLRPVGSPYSEPAQEQTPQ
jgi:lipopolysaccharide assembly protein A